MIGGDADNLVGRRLRQRRAELGLSQRAAAGLAGLSKSYWSVIERGEAPVDNRSTLKALARAVRMSPADLAGEPLAPDDPVTAEARAAVGDIEAVLSDGAFGDGSTPVRRPWRQVQADLSRLNTVLRPAADYAAQGRLLPTLISDLHAAFTNEPEQRREVLAGLLDGYHAAQELAKTMSVPGVPVLAAIHAQSVAEYTEDPALLGLAAWIRGMAIGTTSRGRMLSVSRRAADALRPALNDTRAAQVFGAVSLSAALAASVNGDQDEAADHLQDAQRAADATEGAEPFGALYFGHGNVGIWKMSLAAENGDLGTIRRLAGTIDPTEVPSTARQAMFYGDLGRGLAARRGSEESAVAALRTGEQIGPSTIRNNFFCREAVTSLMLRVNRDTSLGREVRGMAFRMGLTA